MSKELLVAVIDDDEPFRMALAESLGSLGYDARGFASAEEFMAEMGKLHATASSPTFTCPA